MTHKSIPLGKLCTIEKGSTGIMKAIPGSYPMVTLAEQRTSHNEYQFDAKAVIVPLISSTGHGHASMKRVHYQEGKFALGSILCAVIPKDETVLNARFLHNYLSFFKDSVLVTLMRGAANVSLSIKSISSVTIPLPALEEQLAINELIEVYSLKAKAFHAEFQTQQTLLTQLRQSILQEAVQGKLTQKFGESVNENLLVTQAVTGSVPVRTATPQPETGADLLARIRSEKAELIQQGKLRKEKPLPPINDAEKPFELPEGWVWCRLGEIAEIGTGATPLTTNTEYYKGGTIPWVTSSLTGKPFVRDVDTYITDMAIKETNCRIYPAGTLLIAMYGQGKTRGQITELLIDAATNQACATIECIKVETRYFLKLYFSKIYEEIRELAAGGAQPNLNMQKISTTVIPLPPFTEQQAIVAQVDQLLEQVNELVVENKQQQVEVSRLMQAVLSEAFAGKKEIIEVA